MSTEISTKLEELPHLPKPELLALWQELFAKPAHPRLRRNLMIPILAYRLQERVYGGLKPSTRKRLQKLAAELQQNQKAPPPFAPQLKAGTKLLRQWQGEMHEVLVAAPGALTIISTMPTATHSAATEPGHINGMRKTG